MPERKPSLLNDGGSLTVMQCIVIVISSGKFCIFSFILVAHYRLQFAIEVSQWK